MASDEEQLCVEVVYALALRQVLRQVRASGPLTALQAVQRSGLMQEHPEIDPARAQLGVFGEPVAPRHVLRDGDRVEIYRPLQRDPREARRRLAERGQAMGREPARPDRSPEGS